MTRELLPEIHIHCNAGGHGGWPRHTHGFVPALARHFRIVPTFWDAPDADEIAMLGLDSCTVADTASNTKAIGLGLGPIERMDSISVRPSIAFTVWETTTIPPEKLAALERADEIWVPSHWGRQLFAANGIPTERIAVIPEGVDPRMFAPSATPRPDDGIFRFLCVGKWEERKGTADLLRAFSRAFEPSDPVELLLFCTNPYRPDIDVECEIAKLDLPSHAPIRVVPPLDNPELARLYAHADTFVLPTRAEGWGLPIIEAMACALPVIVTDYGGQTEYVNQDNAYPLHVAGMTPVNDPVFFGDGAYYGEWAQPDIDHLIHLLRHVADNREEASAKGQRAREDVLRQWTWEHAAAKASRRIGEILNGNYIPL